jgi:hypothetical protein
MRGSRSSESRSGHLRRFVVSGKPREAFAGSGLGGALGTRDDAILR